jgi:hypothetical protein
VTRTILRVVEALALPTIALAIVAAVAPGRLSLALQIYGLVVAGMALLALLLALQRAYPPLDRSLVDEALERPEREEERLTELARLEREVTLGVASTYDLHFRLRPTLRETASSLLLVRRGVDLDREPARARAVLGDETWELVRPDREPPADRLARGLDPEVLVSTVESLEAI